MCLIFDVLDTPFERLSLNKSGTAELSDVLSILETRRRVHIACREARLDAIYSASVVEPATDLYFVLLKHTASAEIVNTYPRIDFQSTGSEVWSASAKACMSPLLDVPA